MDSILLDTHVVLWLAVEPTRIPKLIREQLEESDSLVVSAASPYEIAQKVRLGRLPQAAAVLSRWNELLHELIAEELPLTGQDMLLAGSMPWEHPDPFDRMLVAQSQRRGLPICTKDRSIQSYPAVKCIEWA